MRFGRRMMHLALAAMAVVVFFPLLVAVVLAAVIGGWTSVVIALVSWIALGLLLAIGLRFALRAMWPVRSLIDTAGRLADGDYTARVDTNARAPFQPVVKSFNRMADRLERAEDERRRLVADVGHELRTPLTIIRGELEAMADGIRDLDQAQIEQLLIDIGVMERLLDDLQTLSRAEAGRLRIHRESIDLIQLTTEAVARFRNEAAEAGVTLTVEQASLDHGELEAELDPIRIREVLANLITNGLRATDSGGRVTLTVRRSNHDGTDQATIEVTDTGSGIGAEELNHVFDRFHRGRRSNGSGLGLTISRNLVEAHGGEISIKSTIGVGTSVYVRLPLQV